MSSSSSQGRITVEPMLGVDVRILDDHLSVIAQASSTRLSEQLSPGIYTVRWTAGDTAAQQSLRLRASDHLRPAPERLLPGSAASDDGDLALRQFSALGRAMDAGRHSTRLIVFVCANDIRTRKDVGDTVRLRRPSLAGSRSSKLEPVARSSDREDGWSATEYSCKAGSHSLRYLSSDRLTIEQTVYLPKGRTTVVWLRYGVAYASTMRPQAAGLRTNRGIDPSRTRIASFSGAVDQDSLRKRFLLVESLLADLSARRGTMTGELIKGVAGVDDPYVRLFAAALLLTRPLLPDDLWRDEPDRPMAAPRRNCDAAMRLLDLDGLFDHQDWPDAVCAWWRLAQARGRSGGIPGGTFDAPPMLETAWRWATAWSVEHPEAIDPARAPSIAAVAKGQERTTPWLTWRAEDVRAHPRPDGHASAQAAEFTLQAIGELSSQLKFDPRIAGVANTLSSETRGLVQAADRVGAAERWSSGGSELLSRLAGSTGLPGSALESAANAALEELRSLPERHPDLWESDPNKGMFGGSSSADGVEVSLRGFDKTNDKRYLALAIEVRGSDAHEVKGAVTLYLHPTFDPARVAVAAVENVARYTCYSVGGFTLGVVTADGIRLELDLAEDERLPQWFRDN